MKIGGKILAVVQMAGEMLTLLWETLFYFKEAPRNLPAIFRQMGEVGVETLPIASLMALFVGMVLALQTGTELALYGTQEAIGAIVGLSMVKELGPVMTSLLVAGRIGSAMAAEVGAMEVYEEIDALKTLEINPVRYLAMPRLLACLFAVPALVVFAVIIGSSREAPGKRHQPQNRRSIQRLLRQHGPGSRTIRRSSRGCSRPRFSGESSLMSGVTSGSRPAAGPEGSAERPPGPSYFLFC